MSAPSHPGPVARREIAGSSPACRRDHIPSRDSRRRCCRCCTSPSTASRCDGSSDLRGLRGSPLASKNRTSGSPSNVNGFGPSLTVIDRHQRVPESAQHRLFRAQHARTPGLGGQARHDTRGIEFELLQIEPRNGSVLNDDPAADQEIAELCRAAAALMQQLISKRQAGCRHRKITLMSDLHISEQHSEIGLIYPELQLNGFCRQADFFVPPRDDPETSSIWYWPPGLHTLCGRPGDLASPSMVQPGRFRTPREDASPLLQSIPRSLLSLPREAIGEPTEAPRQSADCALGAPWSGAI